MKLTKKALLIIILAIYGQAVFFLWSYVGDLSVTIRALVITISTKFLGDFLGKFVFKMEQYNWVYLRDYLQNNLVLRLSVLILFTMFWLAPILFLGFWGMNGTLIESVLAGGLIPALYYGWINRHMLAKSTTNAHRLKRHL